LNLQNVCVLDPESDKTLEAEEAKDFEYFIFGGILGDNPPRKRTGPELTKFIKNPNTRNIGKEQMSTDNAVAVVKEIANGKELKELKFQEGIEIEINEIESTILPYRYLIKDKSPLISKELIKFLKEQE
jgi:ribosome biogenesis SPOUT family RNA methylase Rps3